MGAHIWRGFDWETGLSRWEGDSCRKTGRVRRSKWCGEVPTQQSQAFVCSKHVLSDGACWPISQCCLSNRLILPQQPAGSGKKTDEYWGQCCSHYMLNVLKLSSCVEIDVYKYSAVLGANIIKDMQRLITFKHAMYDRLSSFADSRWLLWTSCI